MRNYAYNQTYFRFCYTLGNTNTLGYYEWVWMAYGIPGKSQELMKIQHVLRKGIEMVKITRYDLR